MVRKQKYRQRHVACGPGDDDDDWRAAYGLDPSNDGHVPNMKTIARQYDDSKYDRYSRRQAPPEVKVVRKPGTKVAMSRTRMMFLQRTGQSIGDVDMEGSMGTDSNRFRTTDASLRRDTWLGSIHDKQEFDTKFVSKPPAAYQHVQSRLHQPRKTPRKEKEKDKNKKSEEKTESVQLAGKTITIDIGKELKRLEKEGKVPNKTSDSPEVQGGLASIGKTRVPVFPNGYAAKKAQRQQDMVYYEMWRSAFVKAIRELRCAEVKNEASAAGSPHGKSPSGTNGKDSSPVNDRKLFVASSQYKMAGGTRGKQGQDKESVHMPVVSPLLLQSPEGLKACHQFIIHHTNTNTGQHSFKAVKLKNRRKFMPTGLRARGIAEGEDLLQPTMAGDPRFGRAQKEATSTTELDWSRQKTSVVYERNFKQIFEGLKKWKTIDK